MHLGNRWVPAEVVNVLIVISALMALVILGALFWFDRSAKKPRNAPEKKQKQRTIKKRSSRKK